MGSVDIPPFMRDKMKQKIQEQKKEPEIPPFMQSQQTTVEKKSQVGNVSGIGAEDILPRYGTVDTKNWFAPQVSQKPFDVEFEESNKRYNAFNERLVGKMVGRGDGSTYITSYKDLKENSLKPEGLPVKTDFKEGDIIEYPTEFSPTGYKQLQGNKWVDITKPAQISKVGQEVVVKSFKPKLSETEARTKLAEQTKDANSGFKEFVSHPDSKLLNEKLINNPELSKTLEYLTKENPTRARTLQGRFGLMEDAVIKNYKLDKDAFVEYPTVDHAEFQKNISKLNELGSSHELQKYFARKDVSDLLHLLALQEDGSAELSSVLNLFPNFKQKTLAAEDKALRREGVLSGAGKATAKGALDLIVNSIYGGIKSTPLIRGLEELTGMDKVSDELKDRYDLWARASLTRGESPNRFSEILNQTLETAPQMVGLLLTKNLTAASIAFVATPSFGQSYKESLEQGLSEPAAYVKGISDAAIQSLSESIVADKKLIAGFKPSKELTELGAKEFGSEAFKALYKKEVREFWKSKPKEFLKEFSGQYLEEQVADKATKLQNTVVNALAETDFNTELNSEEELNLLGSVALLTGGAKAAGLAANQPNQQSLRGDMIDRPEMGTSPSEALSELEKAEPIITQEKIKTDATEEKVTLPKEGVTGDALGEKNENELSKKSDLSIAQEALSIMNKDRTTAEDDARLKLLDAEAEKRGFDSYIDVEERELGKEQKIGTGASTGLSRGDVDLKELGERKLPTDGGGDWRQKFNEEKEPVTKSAILRSIAETNTSEKAFSDILDVIDGMPEESNIAWAIANNPKSSKEVFEKAVSNKKLIGSTTDENINNLREKRFGKDPSLSSNTQSKEQTASKGGEQQPKKSVLERPIEEVSIDDILDELKGDEGLAFKDVSNKDIKEGDTKNIDAYNRRAERVLKTLYPNAEFQALNTTKEYEQATGKTGQAGLLVRGKGGKHKLFLNLEAIKNSNIERTATHEVVHALVSDAIGAKYSDLRKKWDSLLPKLYNVKGFEVIKEHIENYPSADRPVEGITDLIANVVHNKIKIEDVPKNLWDEFIELINRAFEAIGIDYKITPDTFNGFAKSVKEAFETGNLENLKKFTSKSKTEKFFKEHPEFAEAELAMIDPAKRKQLEDLLKKKIEAELKSGNLTQEQANEIFKKAGIEPPVGKPPTEEVGDDGGDGITHAQTAETRTKFGFEEYEKKPETFEQWDKEADERISKGEMPKLIEKLKDGYTPSAVEQRMMGKYIAELGRKAEENPSDENLNKLHDAIVLSDIVGGREVGKSLVSRKGTFLPDDSLAAFFEAERMNNKDAPLTEKQKETVKKEWEDLERAKNEYNAYVFQKESELAAREAQAKISEESKSSATRKKGARKSDSEFAEERKQIISSIKEKLKKARGETQATILPYAKELIAISPDVAKLVRNLVDNGITKLADIVDRVHEILKEDIEQISKQDVIDLIAGNYNEKKKTKNQLARDLYELRTEAQLINKLNALLRGEKPKSEKKLIKRNQEIEELRKQIKSLTADDVALDRVKSNLNSQIQKIEEQIRKGDFAKPEQKPKIKLDKEGNALRDKLIKLQQQRDARMLLQQRQNESGREKALRYVAEVFNIPRTLMTIGDFSGLLRQNLFFSVGHPLITSKALPGMFKSFTSQKVYDRWFADFKETPRYNVIRESRLAIADTLNHDLSKREENFMSTLAEKIPLGVGKVVKGSERSYTMLLNKVRVDMFNYFADQMEARGMTVENSPKQYKAMAEYINNATGRSDFGENLNRIAPILNATFFSPRLIASRVNMLTYWAQPRFWKTLPKEARIDYFRNWASLLAVGGTIMGLAALAGADVEDDPRSSDFGKIKSGDTRWDIWGGAQPYVRTFAQVATGKRKSTNTGKIYDLDGDDIFGENRMGVVTDFFRNKLAPVPASAVDILSGRTSIGDKIVYQWGDAGDKEISIDQYVKDRLLPMTITGTEEAIKHDGLKTLFTVGIPSTFGIGTQTYSAPPPKEETFKIYQDNGNKVRNATKEEVERYKKEADSLYSQELKKAEQGRGWGYNNYGELTLDDRNIKKRGDFKSISEEDKKKLLSRLRSTSNQKIKDKFKY